MGGIGWVGLDGWDWMGGIGWVGLDGWDWMGGIGWAEKMDALEI